MITEAVVGGGLGLVAAFAYGLVAAGYGYLAAVLHHAAAKD